MEAQHVLGKKLEPSWSVSRSSCCPALRKSSKHFSEPISIAGFVAFIEVAFLGSAGLNKYFHFAAEEISRFHLFQADCYIGAAKLSASEVISVVVFVHVFS